jgi:hypothetical protein
MRTISSDGLAGDMLGNAARPRPNCLLTSPRLIFRGPNLGERSLIRIDARSVQHGPEGPDDVRHVNRPLTLLRLKYFAFLTSDGAFHLHKCTFAPRRRLQELWPDMIHGVVRSVFETSEGATTPKEVMKHRDVPLSIYGGRGPKFCILSVYTLKNSNAVRS